MKGFFLFIVINVFVWNTVVYAGEDKLETAKNIYELDMIIGEYKNLDQYNGKMLIISNLFTNMKLNEYNKKLMDLSKNYHKYGLRVFALFNDQLNNTEPENNEVSFETKDEHKGRFINSMNNNKIDILCGDEAMNLWNSMKKYQEYITVYHTFLVDRSGTVSKGYFKDKHRHLVMTDINEIELIDNLKPWNRTKSVYELEIKNHNDVSVPMKAYRNNVLIVSFMVELIVMKVEEKFRSLLYKAKNSNTDNLIILVFLDIYTMNYLEKPAKLISESYTEPKVHLFKESAGSDILKEFCRLKLKEIDDSVNTKYITEFIINQEGKIVGEFKDDMEDITIMLEEQVLTE